MDFSQLKASDIDPLQKALTDTAAMLRQGRGAAAIPLLERAIPVLKALVVDKAQHESRHADAELGIVWVARELANLGCAYYQRWTATARQADLELCMSKCQEALQTHAKCVEAMVVLGSALDDLQQYAAAQDLFARAVEIEPKYADAWANLGMIHHRQDRLAEARSCYEKAVEADPLHANAWNNLGEVYREQNAPKESADCYRRALAAQPGHRQAAENLRRIESLDRKLIRDASPRQERTDEPWHAHLVKGALAGLERGSLDFDQALTLLLTDEAKTREALTIVEGLRALGERCPGQVRAATARVAQCPRLRQRELFVYAVLGAFLKEPEASLPVLQELGGNDHGWVRYAVAEALFAAFVRWNVSTETSVETAMRLTLDLLEDPDTAVRMRVRSGLRPFWKGQGQFQIVQRSVEARTLLLQLDERCP